MFLAASLFDPSHLLASGGLVLLALIVFAESGLLVGFLLPGDSLLFAAGFLASGAGGHVLPPLPLVLATVFVAAVVGDQVGYLTGRHFGPALVNRPRSRLFRPEHLAKAERFMAEQGPKTIVLARFLPVVRSFAPIMAGVTRMPYRTFVAYNLLGGLLWGVGLTCVGYFLGSIPVLHQNLEICVFALGAICVGPAVFEVVRHRRRRSVAAASLGLQAELG